MNRIDKCFEQLKAAGKKAVMPFVTAGDPDMETTVNAVTEMFDRGADIMLMGVPFSDPIAESTVIQEASLRSLENGTTLDKVFGAVEKIRAVSEKPVVLMMYINTIFAYGTDKFFSLCSEKGVDGVIIPDLPFEEHDEVAEYAQKYDVYNITVAAPSSRDRIKMITKSATGFVYCVSNGSGNYEEFVAAVAENASCPVCGVLCDGNAVSRCDAVACDSAVVELMNSEGENAVKAAGEFAAAMVS